jgi:hypothetical protein
MGGAQQMHKFPVPAVLATMLLLSGCLSVDEDCVKRRLLAQGNLATGTRLVKPTTERVVRAIGNKEYSEQVQHLGIANSLVERGGAERGPK